MSANYDFEDCELTVLRVISFSWFFDFSGISSSISEMSFDYRTS